MSRGKTHEENYSLCHRNASGTLAETSGKEGLAIAELVRRAVDAFLVWDDPTYVPQPTPQIRKSHSSPA